MTETARIASLVDYKNHLEMRLQEAEDEERREVLAEQLDECRCAVEHAINGHRSNDLTLYNPFYIGDDESSLVMNA